MSRVLELGQEVARLSAEYEVQYERHERNFAPASKAAARVNLQEAIARLHKELLTEANSPEFDYCDNYHCAGDCGLPHNSKERTSYIQRVLGAFDGLVSIDRREKLDAKQDVRQRAKGSL